MQSISPIVVIIRSGSIEPEPITQSLTSDAFTLRPLGWPISHPNDLTDAAAIVIESDLATVGEIAVWCRQHRQMLGDRPQAIVWLIHSGDAEDMRIALTAGADVCMVTPFDPTLIIAQLQALLRVRQQIDRVRGRADEAGRINQQLQQAYRQIDHDMELTRRIQRAFAPRIVPEVGQMRFAMCHRPRSRVGGDFFDLIRLDEDHVALSLGDALGRSGAAGSLLGIFVKMSITTKEINGRSYRLIPADEILRRVNRELLSLGMNEPPLVTMVYFQCNCRDGRLEFARAGHPAPLYVPADGPVHYWAHGGTFLGLNENHFPTKKMQLKPGDKLLLVSDGIRATEENQPVGDRLIEAAERWRHLPVQGFVDSITRDLLNTERLIDDVTLVAMEFGATPAPTAESAD